MMAGESRGVGQRYVGTVNQNISQRHEKRGKQNDPSDACEVR